MCSCFELMTSNNNHSKRCDNVCVKDLIVKSRPIIFYFVMKQIEAYVLERETLRHVAQKSKMFPKAKQIYFHKRSISSSCQFGMILRIPGSCHILEYKMENRGAKQSSVDLIEGQR